MSTKLNTDVEKLEELQTLIRRVQEAMIAGNVRELDLANKKCRKVATLLIGRRLTEEEKLIVGL